LSHQVYEEYVEAIFFVVATMTGLGYGNIVPSTNLEWFVDSIIMATGASIYAKFFADFAVEIYMSNRLQIDNQNQLEGAKKFCSQRNVPEESRNKIRHFYNNLRMKFAEFTRKHSILSELPKSLEGEISLMFNS
jgi:hypothetical protein